MRKNKRIERYIAVKQTPFADGSTGESKVMLFEALTLYILREFPEVSITIREGGRDSARYYLSGEQSIINTAVVSMIEKYAKYFSFSGDLRV